MNEEYLLRIRFCQAARTTRHAIADELGYNPPKAGGSDFGWDGEVLRLIKENNQMDRLKRILIKRGILRD